MARGIPIRIAVGISMGMAIGISIGMAIGISTRIAIGMAIGISIRIRISIGMAVGTHRVCVSSSSADRDGYRDVYTMAIGISMGKVLNPQNVQKVKHARTAHTVEWCE